MKKMILTASVLSMLVMSTPLLAVEAHALYTHIIGWFFYSISYSNLSSNSISPIIAFAFML
jgi:hypothetical protein